MKKIIFFLYVFGNIFILFSQKSISKTIDFKGESILINLGNIDHLELIQLSENKVKITTNERQQEASFLRIIQDKKKLTIHAVQTPNLKKQLPACIEQPLLTSYKISVPKKAKIVVVIKSGNFLVSKFNGFLDLQLEDGEVVLKDISGIIKINNIDGIISCSTKIQNIKANSHLGKVFVTKSTISKTKNYFKEMLIIESIRGNIFINTNKMP